MSTDQWLFGHVYFTAQRALAGVDRQMIRDARSVLESPRPVWEERALNQLAMVSPALLTWDDLVRLPIVPRESLLTAGVAAARQRKFRRIEVRRTSGSTGTPFVFPKDKTMTAWMDAAMWAVYGWHGIEPGMPHARFWGRPLPFKKHVRTAVADRLLNRRRVGAFDLSVQNVRKHFRALCRLEPFYAYGYPTLMRRFVELARSTKLDGRELGLSVVISTGEILTSATRQDLVEFFGCPVINEYGCTESGIVGFECEHGSMHAIPVAVWPEIVENSGVPVPAHAEGEVVISDLFGRVMPLLRYRLHDRGRMMDEECSCGRELPMLEIRSGRSDSFIETPGGKIYDAILAYTVPRSVQRFRVHQASPRHLEAQVVPGAGFSFETTPAECKHRWERALGPGMSVSVRAVTDIPLEPSGKLRYFVPLSDTASPPGKDSH